MANAPIESGIGQVWIAKQTTPGTAALVGAAGMISPRFVDGGLKSGKQLDSESWVDGLRFASPSMFVSQVAGELGDITVQGVAEEAGCLFAWILGVDTVTGAADPWTHTITSAGTTGTLLTAWQKTGSAIGPKRELYYDAKIAKLEWEASRDQLVSHATASMMGLIAAEIYTADPSVSAIAEDPLLWSEVVGTVTIGGTVYKVANGESISIDTKMEAYWGDDVRPVALVEGKGDISCAIDMILTDDTLAIFNNAIYGTPAPVAGTKPVNSVYSAAISTAYTRSASRSITITRPNVAIDPADMTAAPKPDGGIIDLSIGGLCLKSGGTPAITVAVKCGRSTTMV